MKIGDFLVIEAFSIETNALEQYRCKVIDKDNTYVYVDYPIHKKTKKTSAGFRIGTKLKAEYLGEDQSVYRFKTEVMDRKSGNIPTLALALPEEDEIERIQRRQYVRVETAVDVAIHSKDNPSIRFSTVTVDISAGGLSVILPKGLEVAEEEKVNIYLVLPMSNGQYLYPELSGEIVRTIISEHSTNTLSIKYENLSEQDKQVIIRFCFEKQREARQKELQ